MSTDNAALVRRGFEAFLRGDFDALMIAQVAPA